jgi:two-component system NtrC family sensor kinase
MADIPISLIAFQTGIELVSDAVVIADVEGRVTFANQAAKELSGAGQLIGMYIDTLFETSMESSQAYVARALAGAEQQIAAVVRHPDGERRAVLVRLAGLRVPASDAQEEIVKTESSDRAAHNGIVATLQDVTDEFRARQAVAKSEARYHNIFEGASDIIYTVDLDGAFTSVNSATCRNSGYTRDELIGRSLVPFLDVTEMPAILEHFNAVRTGESRQYECHLMRRNGERLLLSVTNTPIRNLDEVVGVLGIARDVTGQQRASIEREQLRRQLEQSQKLEAIGQLVSGVAHELNNPLAAVIAYAQLILSKPTLSEEEQHALETILHEAKRAAKIVSNLLTFARQHQPERSATDLNQVINDTIALRRYMLAEQQIQLVLDLDPALPPTWADAAQLQQVLLNLLANAEHALDDWDGERRLAVVTKYETDTIMLRVADSGSGIGDTVVDQIFNPFFTTKGVGVGTGLGLSIADGIVREHGGTIRVESAPGEGAAFIVQLPYVDPEARFFEALQPPDLPRMPASLQS